MARPYEPWRATVVMFGTTPLFELRNLEAVLDAFGSIPDFVPLVWGTQENPRLPYSRAEAVAKCASDAPALASLYLKRNKTVAYEAEVDLGSRPYLCVEVDKSLAYKRWQDVFRLADALAAAFRPDVATVLFWPKANRPWKTDDDRDTELMFRAAFLAPKSYYAEGPRGLSARTYFGEHYIRQFGRDRLLKTPVVAAELPWGGIRLDLAADPWTADASTLVTAWRAAMEFLKLAGVFASTEIEDQSIGYTRGVNCVVGGVTAAPATKETAAAPDGAFAELVASRESNVVAKGVSVGRVDWAHADLSGVRAERLTVEGALLRGASLRNLRVIDATFTDTDFEAAVLDGAGFHDCVFSGVTFRGAGMSGVQITASRCDGADFREADLTGAMLDGTVFDNASFQGANLAGATGVLASFAGANLARAVLTDANLTNADFRGAKLEGALFAGAKLEGALFDVGADPRGRGN